MSAGEGLWPNTFSGSSTLPTSSPFWFKIAVSIFLPRLLRLLLGRLFFDDVAHLVALDQLDLLADHAPLQVPRGLEHQDQAPVGSGHRAVHVDDVLLRLHLQDLDLLGG